MSIEMNKQTRKVTTKSVSLRAHSIDLIIEMTQAKDKIQLVIT